ncbi:MAG: putative ABC transport system permease protein [Planctomycetota bacterium]
MAWRHLLYHRGQSAILIACLTIPIILLLATQLLAERYEDGLRARAANTPQLVGAKGSRFGLVLAALHFREVPLEMFPFAECERIADGGEGLAIPLHLRFQARGRPIVGTSPEYFERRDLSIATGRAATKLGECVLGAEVASAFDLGAGDHLFSDQLELYDISKPPALKMRIVGVLAPCKTPDDGAVFVDVKTAWVLEGLAHGHDDVTEGNIDPALILAQNESHIAVSAALMEYSEVTPEGLASFHFHRPIDELPLSAVLFFPKNPKAATLVGSRTNRSLGLQMIAPNRIVDELLAFVFRIERAIETLLAVLGIGTLGLLALVLTLSTRLREREMRALIRIGAAPSVSLRLHALEFAFVLIVSLAIAGIAMLCLAHWMPDPVALI